MSRRAKYGKQQRLDRLGSCMVMIDFVSIWSQMSHWNELVECLLILKNAGNLRSEVKLKLTGGLAFHSLSSARKFQLWHPSYSTTPCFHDWTPLSCARLPSTVAAENSPSEASSRALCGHSSHQRTARSKFHHKPLAYTMITQDDIAQLLIFHGAHFPNQPTPRLSTAQQPAVDATDSAQNTIATDDELGYYADGVKRTLTDAQINLFRHSEIQRLLSERRAAREKDDERKTSKKTNNSSHGTREARKRRFYDEPSTAQLDVDLLTYDDPPDGQSKSTPAEKKFLWPILGQQPT